MATPKDYKFLKCEDGIYYGRPLRNGNISKDAHKVSDMEVVMLFEDYLRRYCHRNVTNYLEVNRHGKMVFEAKLHIEND